MGVFNNWGIYLVLSLFSTVIFTQFYKISTKKSKSDGALTILLQTLAGTIIILLMPFFEFKFPSDLKIYIFLGTACIFYAIADRLNTTVRSGLEASTFGILRQLSTVFMILFGITLFKEPIVLTKMIGTVLIIFSNVLIFYKKGKIVINKYIVLGILGNIAFAIAMFLDVSISKSFNLSIYVALTLLVPAILIIIFEKIKISEIKAEFVDGDKKAIITTALSWGITIVTLLKAYQLGDVTVIAPLSAISVTLNVIAGYVFLKERNNLSKKIIAAILIIISVLLISIK